MAQISLMRNLLILLFFGLLVLPLKGQTLKRLSSDADRNTVRDTTNTRNSVRPPKQEKQERPPIELYKIISVANDTTIIDTSLTIKKLYKYNYLRKDNFELLPFSNEGQT